MIEKLTRYIYSLLGLPYEQMIVLGGKDPAPTATPAPKPQVASTTSQYTPKRELSGFKQKSPQEDILNLIFDAANQYEIHPSLLAALLFQESSFDPTRIGDTDPNDVGIAQINLPSHPSVAREQALDPSFAIPWAAKYLADSMAQFNDINRTIASYNVGRGGANIQGPQPYGGGPRGQTYIDNVARNLDTALLKELGIITSPGVLAEY